MITHRDFLGSLGLLQELLPMQRALSEQALALAWRTFPQAAKDLLTPDMLEFAVTQRLLDPTPPREQALHLSILRYVFPISRMTRIERGEEVFCDLAIFDRGPRQDLAQRMAQPDRFHDPSPKKPENLPVMDPSMRLPAGGNNLRSFQAAVEAIIERGPEVEFLPFQIRAGRGKFERLLSNCVPPDPSDYMDCANGWILRSPDEARAMVRAVAALACDQLLEELPWSAADQQRFAEAHSAEVG
jgi:hypothetical protein